MAASETRIRDGLWQRSVRTERYKVISLYPFDSPVEVYDIVSDPEERSNLIRKNAVLPMDILKLNELLKPAR